METTTKATGQETVNLSTKEVLTFSEAAAYLGISKSCLYRMTSKREIPHYKSPAGRLCYFNRKEIEAWMQRVRVATDEELNERASMAATKGGKA